MRKVLFINPFGIGDVLFTTPLIHTLKDAFLETQFGYLCNRRTAPILKNNPYIDSVFIYERDEFEATREKSFFSWFKEYLDFLNKIKNEHYELVFDFSLNSQYGFFSWYAGIRERIGYNFKKRGRFLTKKVNLSGYSEKHIVEYYAGLLKFCNIDLKYKNLELYLKEEDKKRADEILAKEDIKPNDLLVGIIPGAGASWGKEAFLKRWPSDKFAQLTDKIVEKYKAKIIIMGDFSEKEIIKSIIDKMHYKAIDLTGKTTVVELASLLNRINLLITNDGGPLHMAVALGKKTVSFFGPVDPKVYGPYPPDGNKHIVLRKVLDCSPCYREFRLKPCLKNKECLESIEVEEALQAVDRLIK